MDTARVERVNGIDNHGFCWTGPALQSANLIVTEGIDTFPIIPSIRVLFHLAFNKIHATHSGIYLYILVNF